MSAFSLILDSLRISSSAEKLNLSVNSTLSLQSSDGRMQLLEPPQLLELLTSGKVWVTRGNGCRLDFTILFHGWQLDHRDKESVIENLGHHVRNAPLWSQIALDAKLEFSDGGKTSGGELSFSIRLKHALDGPMFSLSSNLKGGALADVQPPASVQCFNLQKIEIVMNFTNRSAKTEQLPKPAENWIQLIPLDAMQGFPEEERKLFEDHQDLKGYFSLPQTTGILPLASRSDSSICFKHLTCGDGEMLDSNILRSQLDNTVPSLTCQLSDHTWSASQPSHKSHREPPEAAGVNGTTRSLPIDLRCACKMTDFALRNLIGGRQTRSQSGIKVIRPQPSQNLSQIAPALWSPGFLLAISQRSRFLPTISYALSTSLLRNAQSPGLRRKLMSLSTRQVRPIDAAVLMDFDYDKGDRPVPDSLETSNNIGEAVQACLWTMMQQSLYDPLSARRLSPHPGDSGDEYGATEKKEVDITTNIDKEQNTVKKQVSVGNELFAFLADEFDDIYNEHEAESDEFEALLDTQPNRGDEDEFEDLFENRTPLRDDNDFDALLDELGTDSGMMTQSRIGYWENALETNSRHISDQRHIRGSEQVHIDNQSMLL